MQREPGPTIPEETLSGLAQGPGTNREPEVHLGPPDPVEPVPDPSDSTDARALVQHFYKLAYGVAQRSPHPKELVHAERLLDDHGSEFARFFVDVACRKARQDGFTPCVFGGLMRYLGVAYTVYRRQQAHQAKAAAETASARELQWREQYEHYCQSEVTTYRSGLKPEAFATLIDQVRADLLSAEKIPRFALPARVQAELDDRLREQVSMPSFDEWLRQQEEECHD